MTRSSMWNEIVEMKSNMQSKLITKENFNTDDDFQTMLVKSSQSH